MIKIKYNKITGHNPIILDCTIRPKDENESFESMMKRFKKYTQKSDIIKEYRAHMYYIGPSLKRRKKREAANKRRASEERKRNRYVRSEYL